jgi:pimeloyl-ACP methyl ester carboxylesterase
VFVGHSAGGLYARAFAAQYPNEVAGMVFVDATTPGQFAQIPTLVRGQQTVGAMLQIASALAWFGVPRLADLPAFFMGYEDARVVAEFPQMAAMRALWASPRHLTAAAAEAALVAGTSSAQVVVLTAGQGAGDGWAQAQAELTALSSNSVQRIIPGVSHGAFTLDRQHIAVTIAAIREVVDAARNGYPLAK